MIPLGLRCGVTILLPREEKVQTTSCVRRRLSWAATRASCWERASSRVAPLTCAARCARLEHDRDCSRTHAPCSRYMRVFGDSWRVPAADRVASSDGVTSRGGERTAAAAASPSLDRREWTLFVGGKLDAARRAPLSFAGPVRRWSIGTPVSHRRRRALCPIGHRPTYSDKPCWTRPATTCPRSPFAPACGR